MILYSFILTVTCSYYFHVINDNIAILLLRKLTVFIAFIQHFNTNRLTCLNKI